MNEKKDRRGGEPYWLGHRERLRHRASTDGFEVMRPHEIIEMVLCYAIPRRDLSEVARALISELGSVEGVMQASRERLMAVQGVTSRMADWLLMTSGLLRSYMQVEYQKQYRIWCFKDMMGFITPRWRDVPVPQVRVVYTDYDDRLMCNLKLTDSLYWMDASCFREIMENALAMEAKYVYLLAFIGLEPLVLSEKDEEAVKRLSVAMDSIDVKLMDYILIGEAGFYSMRVDGRMVALDEASKAAFLRERYCGDGDGL